MLRPPDPCAPLLLRNCFKVAFCSCGIVLQPRFLGCGIVVGYGIISATNRIGEAFVLNNENLERDGKITYMPVYMSMFIVPDALPDKLIYRI